MGIYPCLSTSAGLGIIFHIIFTGFLCSITAAEARANLPSLYSGNVSPSAVCFTCLCRELQFDLVSDDRVHGSNLNGSTIQNCFTVICLH